MVTPAHFAWLAINEAGHVPLLAYKAGLRGMTAYSRQVVDLLNDSAGATRPGS